MLINTQKDSAQTVLVLHYTGGGMKEYRSRYKGEQKRALCTIMRSALTWTFHNSWGQWDKKEGDKDFPSTQKARCFFLQLFSSLRFKCLSPALSPFSPTCHGGSSFWQLAVPAHPPMPGSVNWLWVHASRSMSE